MMQLDKLNAPIKDNHIELNLKDPKDLAAGAAAVGSMGYAVYDNVKARRKRNQVRSSLAALEAKNNFLQQRVELTNRLNAWEKRSRVSHRVVRTMGNRITNIHKGAIAAFDAYDKGSSKGPVSPPAANQNRYNAGNVRSMKPPPQGETQQSIKRKLTAARDIGATMQRTVVNPTIKALQEGNTAAYRGESPSVPKARNENRTLPDQISHLENRVRNMGSGNNVGSGNKPRLRGGGGGWTVKSTGLVHKAIEKFFKDV